LVGPRLSYKEDNHLNYFSVLQRTDPLFILGTGRSGTHWIGQILDSHSEVEAMIEERPFLNWSTRMALEPARSGHLYLPMVLAYRARLLLTRARILADKSHPNIWQAEKLALSFPAAKFVAIQRGVEATVASMMRHDGVLLWQKNWREYSLPNRFLGINETNAEGYESFSVAKKCALRWLAHAKQLENLEKRLGDKVFIIEYEKLSDSPKEVLMNLRFFLGLKREFDTPQVKVDSRKKWKGQLSTDDLSDISDVVCGKMNDLYD
jgi:hypothetical protein